MEILIAMSVFLIVLFAVYTSFESSRSTYAAGEQKADIQQSARVSIELMGADLRLAGFGFPTGAGNAITQATATSVTFWADLAGASTTIMNIDVNPGDTTLNVVDASGIQAGDTIYLINGGQWEQLTVQSVNTGVNPNTIITTAGAANAYPWGSQVGRPRQIGYCWFDNPDTDGLPAPAPCDPVTTGRNFVGNTLYQDDGEGLLPALPDPWPSLAENIQGVQFQYFDANDVPIAVPVAAGNLPNIRRMTINLTAQSPQGWWRQQTFNITSDIRPRNL
jgi:hypothetical protein